MKRFGVVSQCWSFYSRTGSIWRKICFHLAASDPLGFMALCWCPFLTMMNSHTCCRVGFDLLGVAEGMQLCWDLLSLGRRAGSLWLLKSVTERRTGFLLRDSSLGAIIRLHLLGGDGVGSQLCCPGLRALLWSEADPVLATFWMLWLLVTLCCCFITCIFSFNMNNTCGKSPGKSREQL